MTARQLLRRITSRHPLSGLKQGSLLSIRSDLSSIKTHIDIRSQWRDDGDVSMEQRYIQKDSENEPSFITTASFVQKADHHTSLGRDASHFWLHLGVATDNMSSSVESESTPEAFHTNQSIFRMDTSTQESIQCDNNNNNNNDDMKQQEEGTTLLLNVPEKINLDCDLTHGGSISIHNKVEGDVRLKTSNGNIIVNKLRGHSIDIESLGEGNVVVSKDLLEAEKLSIQVPSSGRVRAKRIHASHMTLSMMPSESSSSSTNQTATSRSLPSSPNPKFDDDDGGATCDISSLYLTGDAHISVASSRSCLERPAVRVKSHHGHLVVTTTASPQTMDSDSLNCFAPSQDVPPVVDMGGVNGSCEVFVRSSTHNDKEEDHRESCRAHIDSLSPDSVTIFQADSGRISISADRKVEADVRLLSSSQMRALDMDTMLFEADEDEHQELVSMLNQMENDSSRRDDTRIQIQTKAFTANETDDSKLQQLRNTEFIQGSLENKSAEPDSRFDRKIKGNQSAHGSVGKIRIDGASNQALSGFHNSSSSVGGEDFPKPLVVAAAKDGISIETLSWLGNIARRYGLDDNRESTDLGRTATRRGRDLTLQ